MIVLDTSGLLAAIDAAENAHVEAVAAIKASRGIRVLSPFVLAELDNLLTKRVSARAARLLLDEVAAGVYQLDTFTALDVARAREILDTYATLGLRLTDASIVALAERHGTRDILTLDERHFRVVRGRDGSPFRILPSDLIA